MVKLLSLGLLVTMFFTCNIAISAATPTSGVDIQKIENQQKDNEKNIDFSFVKTLTEKVELPTKGWTKTEVNIRKKPNKKSKIIKTYSFNKKIKYYKYNKKWVYVILKNKKGYIYKKYISKKKNKYRIYNLPKYNGYKSWMPYTAITSSGSPQYKLQHQYAYTGKYGIRMVKDRFCVAIGYHFKCFIGQYFDLILANGTVIKCIKGDEKAKRDTDANNIFSRNGCATEFLIDRSSLSHSIKMSGDISSACKSWKSRVKQIKIYKKNILSGR